MSGGGPPLHVTLAMLALTFTLVTLAAVPVAAGLRALLRRIAPAGARRLVALLALVAVCVGALLMVHDGTARVLGTGQNEEVALVAFAAAVALGVAAAWPWPSSDAS